MARKKRQPPAPPPATPILDPDSLRDLDPESLRRIKAVVEEALAQKSAPVPKAPGANRPLADMVPKRILELAEGWHALQASVKRDRSLKLQRLLQQIISSMLESAPTTARYYWATREEWGTPRAKNWMAHHIGIGHLVPASEGRPSLREQRARTEDWRNWLRREHDFPPPHDYENIPRRLDGRADMPLGDVLDEQREYQKRIDQIISERTGIPHCVGIQRGDEGSLEGWGWLYSDGTLEPLDREYDPAKPTVHQDDGLWGTVWEEEQARLDAAGGSVLLSYEECTLLDLFAHLPWCGDGAFPKLRFDAMVKVPRKRRRGE
jgi:hypothetical protein